MINFIAIVKKNYHKKTTMKKENKKKKKQIKNVLKSNIQIGFPFLVNISWSFISV